MSTYFTIWTAAGRAKLAAYSAGGSPITITDMAIGDGNGAPITPVDTMTALVHETFRDTPNRVAGVADNPDLIVGELIVPVDVGGWTVRELGFFDASGDMVAVGSLPESYKPTLAEGASREMVVRGYLNVANVGSVTLQVDTSLVFAPIDYVDSSIAEHEAKADPHPQYLTTAEAAGLYDPLGSMAAHVAAADPHPQYTTAAELAAAVAALVNSSPAALDTLKELADALGNDANFATTITNALALKAPLANAALTGNPTAPTQLLTDNSTRLSNTAWVTAFVAAALAALGSPQDTYLNAGSLIGTGKFNTDTTAAPFTTTLKANPVQGDSCEFTDIFGTWGKNNLTISPNGRTIMGIAGNLICNVPGRSLKLTYDSTTWRLQ